jgi:hypothetical protein
MINDKKMCKYGTVVIQIMLFGRLMLLELTRHSDHHFNSQKKHQILYA